MNSKPYQKKIASTVGIGVMSGTSLDGVDIAICRFPEASTFDLLYFQSIEYPIEWQTKLSSAHSLSGLALQFLENEYSEYLAELILDSVKKSEQIPDFISCHGHTIFHQPENGLTYQMLNGGILAMRTGLKTVCDFRRSDVAQGGQGAPLVPIGDQNLFGQYAACINIGGFANISFENEEKRIAYDISAANIILNHLSEREGYKYDENGALAKSGNLIPSLLKELNSLSYYAKKPPKSLGREWVESEIFPLIAKGNTRDLLATCTAHIGYQIGLSLKSISRKGSVLITGGGAYNTQLINEIKANADHKIHIPDPNIIEGKEAIIFAYLGWLRICGIPNILASVTGGENDICAGTIYLGK